LIGYGCGSTAKALTDTRDLQTIDIVDISPDILEAGRIVFPGKENPLDDPRVNVHVEDGRFFLLTTSRRFDLITSEPPPPVDRGVSNLYSQEYFQLIHDRLSRGGMVTYWLPVHLLDVAQTKAIVRAFCNVFPNASLWCGAGFDWMLLGIRDPLDAVSVEQFRRQWDDPVVGPEMRVLGFKGPEQFGALFLADGVQLERWTAGTAPLTDSYPKRLTHRNYAPDTSLPVYMGMLSAELCRRNFSVGKTIVRLWPPSLIPSTLAHFGPQRTINLLTATTSVNIPLLHECVAQPALRDYIPWALGSDGCAQSILSAKLGAGDAGDFEKRHDMEDSADVYRHLVAYEMQRGDYRAADRYCRLAIIRTAEGDPRVNTLCFVRIYLAFAMGDEASARKFAQQFIEMDAPGAAERRQQIAGYWGWLEQNVARRRTR